MKLFRLKGVSRKYAATAAHYRRVARTHANGLDFSEKALMELHEWESRGLGKIDKAQNGYAYGKWIVDLSVSMWVEDICAGNACKAEFLTTAIERIHNKSKLKNVVATPLFAWRETA